MSEKDDQISQLVEINRALAHDLDVVRRSASALGRERDELLSQIEELSNKESESDTSISVEYLMREIAEIRADFTKEKEYSENVRGHLEKCISDLYSYYIDVQKTRDVILEELKQAKSAMKEVLYRLVFGADIEVPGLKTSSN